MPELTTTTAITSSLDQLPDEASRAPALLLRLVMAELGCSWASFHEEVAGALRLVASTSAAPTGRHGLFDLLGTCLLYTSPSPRDQRGSRMPSSA